MRALVPGKRDAGGIDTVVLRRPHQEAAPARPDIQELKAAMTSDKMRTFILNQYQGAVLPAF